MIQSWLVRCFTVCVTAGFMLTAAPVAAQENRVRIVLAGDSTVTDHAGWGRGAKTLFRDSVECINLAMGGRSSRSFRDEGHWQKCLDAKPDYILIQFGHNDQPGKGSQRESAADGDFREHLAAYVDEAREKNIKPVLITSLTRRKWNSDETISPTLAEYAAATAAVAEMKQVPLVDLHRLSIQQCEAVGATAFRVFEPMMSEGADHTHLNDQGSVAVAELVLSELIRVVPELASHVDTERLIASKVPQVYSRDVSNGELRVLEDDATITIRANDRPILVYNKISPPLPQGIDPVYRRSGFLHPVTSPAGRIVTATFPSDHAHQHGIFSAWVKTTWNQREIDFWNLAKGNGRVLHQRVVNVFAEADRVGFEVDLIHRAEQAPVVDVLRERWRITAVPTDGSYHAFDLHSTQYANTERPLTIQSFHYGGFAVRGPMVWLLPEDRDRAADEAEVRIGSKFLNDRGSDRIKGNHEASRWVCLSGLVDGKPAGITVLCHQENLRSPQKARLHPTKPYFCFTPCVDEPIVIDQQHPLVSKYRYLITDSVPDPEWINRQWMSWNEAVDSN
ncbi:MAG: PmoA family protein [Planctomycetales bacterium]|nr:PmoA family protein [Planctomycetales bacterium]